MTDANPALPPAGGRRATQNQVLVVDDEPTNRLLLKVLLENLGFAVIQAENGREAVERFRAERPGMVFMDVMMPVMDGLEATRIIKHECGDDFVPVIFLTALSDENALTRCIEAGGDDFLTKPFSDSMLALKIRAMERIQELHGNVSTLIGRMRRDEEIAERMFCDAVIADNVALDRMRAELRPAETFNGDVLLTAHAPSDDLHVLLGDFTGHGLAAALGALPASEVFRAMTKKGFSAAQILSGINRKLCHMLPTGMFMAAQFVAVSRELDHITVWNCGMPDILILDGDSGAVKRRIPSGDLPLGVSLEFQPQTTIKRIPIGERDRVLLVSDGVIEARGPDMSEFGDDRLEAAVRAAAGSSSAAGAIIESLDAFCDGARQADDISLVEVPCTAAVLPDPPTGTAGETSGPSPVPAPEAASGTWDFTLTLEGPRLRNADPVPVIIGQIEELEGLAIDRQALFTILTELYVNALDHGVLGLSSKLKESPEGFVHYMKEREARLSGLEEGFVRIAIHSEPAVGGGRLIMQIEDSGAGFDSRIQLARERDEASLAGRGIHLVDEMCESLRYQGCGNSVEAVYAWGAGGATSATSTLRLAG